MPWARRMGRGVLVLWLTACAAACAGSGAVEQALSRDDLAAALAAYRAAPQPADLRAVAAEVLQREARAQDPARRRRAFSLLVAAGTFAREPLEQLADDRDPQVAARAREALLALGDDRWRPALRPLLEAPDSELAAHAVAALRRPQDDTQLAALLDSGFAAVRAAALERLLQGPIDAQLARRLTQIARADPDSALRARALAALVRVGPAALDTLEAAVEREPRNEAAAALGAWLALDRRAALERLPALLRGQPTRRSLELARRVVSSNPQALPEPVRAHFTRALRLPDAVLRVATATALWGVRDAAMQRELSARLACEPVREVKLALALALPHGAALRRAQLEALSRGDDMVAAQAAAERVEQTRGGSDAGMWVARFVRMLGHPAPAQRALSARILARQLSRPDAAARVLDDPDARVRAQAAAAIVAATG